MSLYSDSFSFPPRIYCRTVFAASGSRRLRKKRVFWAFYAPIVVVVRPVNAVGKTTEAVERDVYRVHERWCAGTITIN